MRSRSFAFLGLALLLLLATPLLLNLGTVNFGSSGIRILASSSNSPYTENLSMYLTSTDSLSKINLSGGNISLSSVSVPSSVGSFSVILTQYSEWEPQYELFTQHGFGLLGPTEPYPEGAVLSVNTTSESDASQLASTLSQQFALDFVPMTSTSGNYLFFSPANFETELQAYFWNIVPTTAGGFASTLTESQIESANLGYFELSYTSGSPNYSLSYGGIMPLSSTSFGLYSQLGLSATSYNYSKSAQSSTINVNVLGGLISNSSVPFTNNFSNLSATIALSSKSSTNGTIPNINATLDFSFPTILAYRQVTPSLTPGHLSNVSVDIFVRNVSPSGTPAANDVSVNDTWIYAAKSQFNLTVGKTGQIGNLTSGSSMTIAYAFTVLVNNGTFTLPATPVTYQFVSAANRTETATAYLNPETIVVGGSNTPLLEATESLPSGTIQAGQTFSVNVTVVNKGSGTAFNVQSSGLTDPNPIPQGSSWSFLSNTTSSALTKTNATVSYPVTWKDASGALHNSTTNTMSAVFSFGSPGTPGTYLRKNVIVASNSSSSANKGGVSANISLIVSNSSPTELKNLTILDPLPSGVTFASAYNSSSIKSTGDTVDVNVSSIGAGTNQTFLYSVNLTNPQENYVFLPANVSSLWNNVTVTHFSNGVGVPLGVIAMKSISPSQGFTGTNVTVSINVQNKGSLPVYEVSLNNTADTFLNVSSSKSAFQAVLNPGGQMNASVSAELTGSEGTYNSSSAAASFIFLGTNQTVSSTPYRVTVYSLPSANLTYSALKVEESHDIVMTVTITNPSNVTINNVSYSQRVPSGLTIKSGSPNFTVATINPHSSATQQFTIETSTPNLYQFPAGQLTFQYQGHELKGVTSTFSINIGDDITLRYGIPIVIGLVLVALALFYIRRLTSPK